MEGNNKKRMLFIVALLLLMTVITAVAHMKNIGTVFTHLYYIPIIFACIWWQRKGFIIYAALSLMLITVHFLTNSGHSAIEDFLRIAVIFLPTIFVSELSVKENKFADDYLLQNKNLTKQEKELVETQAKLKEQIEEMEKLQKLTFDRELKMVELKKQLEEKNREIQAGKNAL